MASSGRRRARLSGWMRAACLFTAAAAVAYCLYALLGADAELLAYATVAILFSAALYPFFRQRMLESSKERKTGPA